MRHELHQSTHRKHADFSESVADLIESRPISPKSKVGRFLRNRQVLDCAMISRCAIPSLLDDQALADFGEIGLLSG